MYLKEIIINNVKREKRMAEFPAFGEPTHARPIASELAWHSLNRGLGHSKDLITLSLSLSQVLTASHTLLRIAGDRASIYGFLCINARKAAVFFISITQRINNQNKQ
jgi:hypothetical protein